MHTGRSRETIVVVYEDDDMKIMVEKVLSHIVWLLEEVQKGTNWK